ncbi:hypothetical protein DITRI_Ditri10aG0022800 [Diplodiscus trichospermus]
MAFSSWIPLLFLLNLLPFGTIFCSAAVVTFQNQCIFPVWTASLSGNGDALSDGVFALAPGSSAQFQVQPGWSGRLWGRTGCTFDNSGSGKCISGDCDGMLKCTVGGAPPVTMVEFTFAGGPSDKDSYDVSLVDGCNVAIRVDAVGGSGDCGYAGCVADLNINCPVELQVRDSGSTVACKSACAAFNTAEFCCTGNHSTPQTCLPTKYSEMFKKACPRAYTYAYDDASNTRTCSGSNYLITFCPR